MNWRDKLNPPTPCFAILVDAAIAYQRPDSVIGGFIWVMLVVLNAMFQQKLALVFDNFVPSIELGGLGCVVWLDEDFQLYAE